MMAATLVLASGALLACRHHRQQAEPGDPMRGRWWWGGLAAAAILVASAGILGLTRSRSGLLAAVVALVALACAVRGWRERACLGCAGLLAVIAMAAAPGGADRIANLGSTDRDPSQGIRLDLWRGALIAAHDAPLTGLGRGNFDAWFRAWHQDPGNPHRYPHALSEPLTVLAEHGIDGLIMVFAPPLALASLAMVAGRNGPHLLAAAGAALLALLAASTCNTFRHAFWPIALAMAIAAGAVAGLVWQWRRFPARAVATAGLMLVAVCSLLAGASVVAGAWAASTSGFIGSPLVDGASPQARPRTTGQYQTVIVLPGDTDRNEEVCRFILRPLAEAGFTAHVARDGASATGAPTLLALREGADRAAAMVEGPSPPKAVVACDATPQAVVRLLQAGMPLLLVHGARDPQGPGPDAPPWFRPRPEAAWLAVPWGRTWPNRFPQLLNHIQGSLRTQPP